MKNATEATTIWQVTLVWLSQIKLKLHARLAISEMKLTSSVNHAREVAKPVPLPPTASSVRKVFLGLKSTASTAFTNVK